MGKISDCWHLNVNLKQNIYKYINPTTRRCPNKIIRTFLIEDFYICTRVNDTSGAPWAANIFANFLTIRNCTNGLLRSLGELIFEKTWSRKKSRDTVPLRWYKSIHHYLGSGLNPASGVYRILFVTWWIFISFLTAVYTAQLTAVLTRATK